MVDREVVRRRLRQIDQRVGALREIARRSHEAFLSDYGLQAAAERHLQVAIQATLDIALHVLAEDSAQTPDDYGSAFALLAQEGVIPGSLAERLRPAAGLRNILVHAYLDVDPRQLLLHLDDVDDLTEFARHIEYYIATEKENQRAADRTAVPQLNARHPCGPGRLKLWVRRYRRGRRVSFRTERR